MTLICLKIFLKKIKPNLGENLRLKQRQSIETIKMIVAKKDKNIKGNYTAKIKEYAHMISDIHDLQQETKKK